MREAEPVRAAFYEEDGQVFQRATDDPDVALPFYDLTGSNDPAQEAREIASSIQRTPMPFTGRLFKFALFQTRRDRVLFVYMLPSHRDRRVRYCPGRQPNCDDLLCGCLWCTRAARLLRLAART